MIACLFSFRPLEYKLHPTQHTPCVLQFKHIHTHTHTHNIPIDCDVVLCRVSAASVNLCLSARRALAAASHFSRSPSTFFCLVFVARSNFRWSSSISLSCAAVTLLLRPPALAVNTTVCPRPHAATNVCLPTRVLMTLGTSRVSAPICMSHTSRLCGTSNIPPPPPRRPPPPP
jgi:hypothetical protein